MKHVLLAALLIVTVPHLINVRQIFQDGMDRCRRWMTR
jgi:hypothetical protein